jgi:protein lifeguard
MIAAVQLDGDLRMFCLRNPGVHLLCTVIAIVAMCAIICCYGRSHPTNLILCGVFTLAEGYCVAGFTAPYDRDLVVTAGLATALISISLTIYAFYTKTDFEVFMALAFVIYLAMLPMLLFGGLVMGMKGAYIGYCALGVMLYSIFLIIDTKMIIDTNKSFGGYDVSYDDYVIAAMQLYLDIIMIFVYILSILGASGGD